ncbi:hypothetical protein [Pontivivens ytuae]|uniref:hypothetical protein n=1 Tax=Pontivivens ytuae TaxID=2789856 RepID=UPI001E2BEB99|nr:hypothetical protein [Pontivivens ytuae]
MNPLDDPREEDDALRRRWRELVGERLPRAARTRDWPVHEDHCFARILLDATMERPWREVVEPPAWANTPPDRLAHAIALGEAVLEGTADLHALNRLSLKLRGKLRS